MMIKMILSLTIQGFRALETDFNRFFVCFNNINI